VKLKSSRKDKSLTSGLNAKTVSIGAVATGLAVWAGPKVWRLAKGSSWNEDIEAVYGKGANRTPSERTADAAAISAMGQGGGGH
jgi:hypothetical protein